MFELDVKKTVRGTVPKVPFLNLAKCALPGWNSLSVVICGDKLSRNINKKLRGKDYVPNVLSFRLSKTSGEIFLNPKKAKGEAAKFDRSFAEHFLELYVHGLAHLAGYDHGDKMDKFESKIKSSKRV